MNRLPNDDAGHREKLKVAGFAMLARAVVIHAVDLRAAASGLPETGKLQRAVEQRATAVTEKLLEEAFERAGPGADVRAEMRELMLGVARWTIDTLEAAKFPGRG